MKKIGILNFQFSNNNYGAVLQAAALEHFIRTLGFDVCHIDLRPGQNKGYIYYIKKGIKKILGKTESKIETIQGNEVFEKFRIKYLNRTDKYFYVSNDLIQTSKQLDFVIVGSDQVWRPEYTSGQPLPFFLNFISSETKKISYAASFGIENWSENYSDKLTKDIRKCLVEFNAISVREGSGVDICRTVFGVKSKHVLDPTLLIGREFFDSIISDSNSTVNIPYLDIVYYKLDEEDEFSKNIKLIANKFNYTFGNIYYSNDKFNDVASWLASVRSAKLVITDSYHCVCFCILFKKQFICLANPSRGLSRLTSLLDSIGLSGRLCFSTSEISNIQFEEVIDYVNLENILMPLREESMNFLTSSLKSENE